MHAKSPVTRENIFLIFTSPISSDWKNFSAGTVPIGKKCDLRESSCSFRATGACGARSVSGGVAERLIAPVLKTGRPKGLVSSNLTPSAILLRAFRASQDRQDCAKQDALRSFSEGGRPVYYLYLIESLSVQGERYVGMTTDLKQRLQEHNAGKSSHTSKFRPWKLTTYIAFTDRIKAEAFEQYLKSGSGHAFASKRLW